MLDKVKNLELVLWNNPNKVDCKSALEKINIPFEAILDAEKRLIRFAPLIRKIFPETLDGIIESDLVEINNMKTLMEEEYNTEINGRMFLKCDSHLKIAGSIKARGGIYEVLKHAEKLAIENNMLSITDDYSKLSNEEFKKFFSKYKIAVGSTGNLGLSIGIISAALGFQVTVHMSRDAKQWKKAMLRSKGARVIEYEEDYSKAVEEGRKACIGDPYGYFIDDENSIDLFLGYAVAALRLKQQLENKDIFINKENPLYVYLPCGVGGAPGGITFGLKQVYGEAVHCYFVEPTHSPCMLLGLMTQKFNELHVKDYGIDNVTQADGLAVGSPSGLVCRMADLLIDGIYTLEDKELFKLLVMIKDTENIKIEPSAASSLLAPILIKVPINSIHISWATGGGLLPDDIYEEMYRNGK